MKIFKRILWILGIFGALCLLIVGFLWLYLPRAEFGFARDSADDVNRAYLVASAQRYLDVQEGSPEHHAIIDTYNAHQPLAQGYEVKYDDNWCATFVSVAAIETRITDVIPTECSCERQIGLWQELDRWEETDSYLPLPGDIIYYDWDVRTLGDSTGWSDHVGIVVGTHGPFIKVIEGNKDDAVGYRYIIRWDPRIRGYGILDDSVDQIRGNVTMIVATDLPGSPAIHEEFFYAYDTNGVLYKVWKPSQKDMPEYDASDRLVQGMQIYVTLTTQSVPDPSESGDPARTPVLEVQADLIQEGYTPTSGGEITGGGQWFLATVLGTSKDSILVTPRDDSNPVTLTVHTSRSTEFSPGDTVLVAYEGVILDYTIENVIDIFKGEGHWHMFSTVQLGLALFDIDQDGKEELCGLGYGPTSGLFTFVVTAWEDGKVEHFGCFCTQFYHLSFAEDTSGTVHIQGVTQDENPETVYFDMTATNGIVQLANNGEPVSPWGPLK